MGKCATCGNNYDNARVSGFCDGLAEWIGLVTLSDARAERKIHHANVVGVLVLDDPVDTRNHARDCADAL